MYVSIMFFVAPLIFLLSTARSATIAQIDVSNSALTSQADTVDAAVVAITAQTPPTTAQVRPYQDSSALILFPLPPTAF